MSVQSLHILQQTITNKITLKKWDSIDAIIDAHPNYKKQIIARNLNGVTKSAYNFSWEYYTPKPEVYKQLNCFPNFDISTHGNIKNNTTQEQVKKFVNNKGFQYVIINQNDPKSILTKLYPSPDEAHFVHLLVADTFLGNTNFCPFNLHNTILVYHKDGNKSNNMSENLTFDRPNYFPTKVDQIDLKTCEVIRTFNAIQTAAKFIPGLTEHDIVNACTGRCNSAKGFAWRFVYD